jgi:hypothetical protein
LLLTSSFSFALCKCLRVEGFFKFQFQFLFFDEFCFFQIPFSFKMFNFKFQGVCNILF